MPDTLNYTPPCVCLTPTTPTKKMNLKSHSTGLLKISITMHPFRKNKSKCDLTSALSRGLLVLKQCLESGKTDERAPLMCKESFYFEKVCIDRRHSSNSSGKGVPKDWHAHFSKRDSVNVYRATRTFKIEDLNTRSHFIEENH